MLRLKLTSQQNFMQPMGMQGKGYALVVLFSNPV
jgi:hypothetical protein